MGRMTDLNCLTQLLKFFTKWGESGEKWGAWGECIDLKHKMTQFLSLKLTFLSEKYKTLLM